MKSVVFLAMASMTQVQRLSGGDILNVCVNTIHAGSVDPNPERWMVTQEMLEREIAKARKAKAERSGEKGMPPLFIACGYGDRPDISEGMVSLYLKYKAAGVKAELHIYSNAVHSFAYKPGTTTAAGRWPERFTEWLTDSGLLK
jgi:acetyl esterase/lipase